MSEYAAGILVAGFCANSGIASSSVADSKVLMRMTWLLAGSSLLTATATERGLTSSARFTLLHSRPAENLPALHYKAYAADRGDVCQRIAIECDDVGFHPHGERTDLVAEAHGFRVERCRGGKSAHRINPSGLYPADQIFRIATVRASHGVCSVEH